MSDTAYSNFDLLLEREGERYRARVLNSPAGEATIMFDSPFSGEELISFSEQLSRPGPIRAVADSPELDVAKEFGGRLFKAVFDGQVQNCLSSSLAIGAPGLRIRLRMTETPELAGLPWEYLYNADLNDFLALSSSTPLVRYIDLPRRIQALAVEPPLRVLVMISSPSQSQFAALNVEQEWTKLNDALKDLTDGNLVVLERLDGATMPLLRQRLRREAIHIFHFIGHGYYDKESEDGVLIMSDEQGRDYPVSGQLLGMQLHDHRSLRLAVLNACEGARGSSANPFSGTAQSLIQQGIPAVIAMQFEITDRSAITFCHEFYRSISDGYPVDAALGEARKAIYQESQNAEWGTPALYMRSPDGQVFANGKTAKAEPGRGPSPGTGPAPAPLDPLEAHYQRVVKYITEGRVVPFLGVDANQCGRPENASWEDGKYPPCLEELVSYLGQKFLLPYDATMDLLSWSQFVMQRTGPQRLYQTLHEVFDQNYPITPLHRLLASIPAALQRKGLPPKYQLIVTTNYDDMMERAYQEAGVPFDLVTYEAEGDNRGKFWHSFGDSEATLIQIPNQYNAFSLDSRAVVLKVHGAINRADPQRDSFVITEDHHLDYLTRTDISALLPVELAQVLKKSNFLFLGSRLPEWNLRVIFHRIWGEQRLVYDSWSVPLRKDNVRRGVWVNRNVDTIPVDLEDYVKKLAAGFDVGTRAGAGR
jgi:hypothetical protein